MTTARAAIPALAPRRAGRARPRPALSVVQQVRGRFARLAVVAGVAATLVAIFGLVAFNVFLNQSQIELDGLEEQVTYELEEYDRLRLELAEMSSPERILDIARLHLGMVDPEAVTNLTAPSDGEAWYEPGSGSASAATRAELKPLITQLLAVE